MNNRRSQVPPPGVSALHDDGSRVPIDADAPAQAVRRKPRPAIPGRREDPIRNVEGTKKVDAASPVGVVRKDYDVVEAPMPATRTPSSHARTFTSVDGQTYRIRTRDRQGKPLAERIINTIVLAIREQRLGGDPLDVFNAFGVRIEDIDGKVLLPVASPPPLYESDVSPLSFDDDFAEADGGDESGLSEHSLAREDQQ